MPFLNELINSVVEEDLREELHERLDIVIHKIKFMDKIPVACLTSDNEPHTSLNYLIELAGGELVADPMLAKVVIYFEHQAGMAALMSKVPSMLSVAWPAVAYNHVYLLDDAKVLAKEPKDQVGRLEDIAEMLHPGFFVFGNEGENWVNFGS